MSNENETHKLPPGCTWKTLDGAGKRWVVTIIRDGEAIRGGGPDRTRGIATIGQVKRRMAELLWSDIGEALGVLGVTRIEYEAITRDHRAMRLWADVLATGTMVEVNPKPGEDIADAIIRELG